MRSTVMAGFVSDSPEWLDNAVFYQIMPDRFARNEKVPVPPGISLSAWNARPGSSGRGAADFYGGNLPGICDHLDHIASTGANTILLTPINSAPSYHRYDTTDYRGLDPLLGSWKDLEMLVHEVHARGLRLVADIALNHVSNLHPWFVKAVEDINSAERDFFTFDQHGKYQCWWGYPTLPELRLDNQYLQHELFLGPDSVLDFWLNKGFDGIRLDCANDLSHEICREIQKAVRTRHPDAAIIGEVANFSAPWLDVLDATQSYFFTASLKSFYAGSITARQFLINMQTAYADGRRRQFQMLSSHDSPRIHSEWKRAGAFLRAARRLQFTLPGLPMIYYGEELRMNGGRDPDNRATPLWQNLDKPAVKKELEELKTLSALRQNSPELKNGHWEPIFTDGSPDLIAFFAADRTDRQKITLVTWNTSQSRCSTTITVPWGWLFSEVQLEEVFTGKRLTAVAGLVSPALEAGECAVWQARDDSRRNYSFFKSWKK